jgi:outer membrane lipoprotein-sorting protein
MNKKILLSVAVLSLFISLSSASELKKPYEGISAEELMKIALSIQYTTYFHDYQSTGDVWLISEGGYKRHKRFERSRIILNRPEDGVYYKDMVVMTEPKSIKGLAVLSWTYLDPKREQDQWLWLPSLKKIRKVSQSEGDDSFIGTDFTTEEVTTRRLDDETYKMLGGEKFAGYHCDYTGKKYYEGTDCFKMEEKPKKENWYYSKRISWFDKSTGAEIYQEIYDPAGQKARTIFRDHNKYPDGTLAEKLLECKNLRNGNSTVIDVNEIKVNQGLSEDEFTEKALMRNAW